MRAVRHTPVTPFNPVTLAAPVTLATPVTPATPATPDRYVLWRNEGPRALPRVEFDADNVVIDWVPLRQVSLPERFSAKCQELGLRRLRYAAD